MKKEEVLERAQKKKDCVGEMERTKISKACWISNIVACAMAVVFMIVQGALGNFSSLFAIAGVCSLWASVFYFCQFFVAKRPKGVLIGAVLHALATITWVVFYILTVVGVL